MGSTWKAALKMTLENAGVLKGLKAHEAGADKAAKATDKARDAMGRFLKAGEGLDTTRKRFAAVEESASAAGKAMSKASGGGGKWAETAGKLATANVAMKGVELAAKGVASTFKAGMNAEKLVRSLGAVTEDAESLKTQMEELRKVGSQPGIDLNTAVQGSAALQSVGQSAKESRETLNQWSNVVATAGGNAETLEGVLMAIRQILSKPIVQQEDVLQILERVPQFARIATALEPLKSNPKKYVAEATKELAKLPRVVQASAESVDNLKDAWDQQLASWNKTRKVASSFMNLGGNILQGEWSQGFKQLKSDLGKVGDPAQTDPLQMFEPGDEEKAKRRAARLEGEKKAQQQRIETAARFFSIQDMEAKRQFEQQRQVIEQENTVTALRINGKKELADALTDVLYIMENADKIGKQTGASEETIVNELTRQLALRREIDSVMGKKAASDAGVQNEIDGLRSRGRDKQARKVEERRTKQERIKALVNDNVPEAKAIQIAEREAVIRKDAEVRNRTGGNRIHGGRSRNTVSGIDEFNFNPDSSMRPNTPALDAYLRDGRVQRGGTPATGFGSNSIKSNRADRLAGAAAAQRREQEAPKSLSGLSEKATAMFIRMFPDLVKTAKDALNKVTE